MSNRELKSLLKETSCSGGTREKTRSKTMSQRATQGNAPHSELSASPPSEANEIESLRRQLARATREEERLKLQLDELQGKMEFDQVKLELEHLKSLDIQRQDSQRQLEEQRQEFQKQFEEMRNEIRCERNRSDSWIRGLTERSQNEKLFYERRIGMLEKELQAIGKEAEKQQLPVSDAWGSGLRPG